MISSFLPSKYLSGTYVAYVPPSVFSSNILGCFYWDLGGNNSCKSQPDRKQTNLVWSTHLLLLHPFKLHLLLDPGPNNSMSSLLMLNHIAPIIISLLTAVSALVWPQFQMYIHLMALQLLEFVESFIALVTSIPFLTVLLPKKCKN